ncbi:nibrin [Drosophila sulfurigaster albostrigata]|uniref:nibrin n=1 Tax=Drosophila sulfurigaster albostrigata TaxID=89887 RepID=UPI002D21ECBA|nr:nibrin [Drosophila sulfurigaster albostrigata]
MLFVRVFVKFRRLCFVPLKMFVLTKVGDDKQKFMLSPNKMVYTVGRLSTDLILSEDLSISRTHVRLCLPSTDNKKPLSVIDLGSKYGTYINNDIPLNKKMPAKTLTPLQVGDNIRFGALKNIWQLSQLKLATTPSSLSRSELEELQQLLQPLGAFLLPSWTNHCTHLTMDNVSVTVKLLHALLDNKPIVSMAFWRALAKFVRRVHVSEDWPQPEDFPPAQSEDMPSIKWNPQRTQLFARKTVVFCNRKHFDMYAPVVLKAGGTCKDLNSGVRRQFLTKDDVIVIQYIPSTQSQATETIHSVQEILNQAGRRLIPDYEIGLAILHCSTHKFCNPAHTIVENTLATTESMDSSILVLNTGRTETQGNANKQTDFVVAESEIYAPSEKSDKAETQAEKLKQTESEKFKLTKKNKMVYLESSDEENVEVEVEVEVEPTKNSAMPKRKRAIIVDSSDEEQQAASQSKKITKTLPGDKSKQRHNQNAAEKVELTVASRRSTRSNQVQEQEAEKEKPTTSRRSTRSNQVQEPEVEEDQPTTSRRSTRSHHVVEEEVEKQKPASTRRSTRGNEAQPQEVEQPKATTSRRSPRGKQSPEKNKLTAPLIDEESDEEESPFQFKTSNKPSQQQSEKVKLTVPQIDEDSDEESNPFQFTEKATESVKTKVPTAKISVRNFLEKSQNHPAASQSVAPALTASQPRKRLRLEVLNESDSDDNDNPFKFASSSKKKKESFGASNNSDNEGVFNFKSNARNKEQSNNASENPEDSINTEPFSIETKSKSKYIMPKPKESNRKINVSGWLTCSGLHEDIKPKTEVEMEAEVSQVKVKDEDIDEKVAHLKWIASMKDSIQIRMCNLSITVRSHDETQSSLDTTDAKYSGRKNFKKFKKTTNLHPQQRVVELRRMQLAEGMVKVL